MSSSGSLVNNIKPENVTAWTLDIETQMLQEEILTLKKNLTDANVKQIKDKETSITEKKNALEKHCRQFGMTHGKYGSQESEIKLETTNGEHTGAMTNGNVNNVSASADVKMDDAGIVMHTNPTDAANSAALDDIHFPQPTAVDMPNSFGIHQETGMATSFAAVAGVDNNDPFVIPAGYATADSFHIPTGTYGNDPFGPPAGDYAATFKNKDSFLNQSMSHTGSTVQGNIDIDEYLKAQGGEMANYTTSAGHVGDTGMGFVGDDGMDMDIMDPHAPTAEFGESVIPGMDK